MFGETEFEQISHTVDRLDLPVPELLQAKTSMELLYIVLVLTVVDPSISQHELLQDACAGTLVRKNLVITSASCLIHAGQDNPDPRDTEVYVRGCENTLRASKIYIHPSFTREEEDYNIAAIEVEGKCKMEDFPKLPSQYLDFNIIKSKCKLSGYGKIASFKKVDFHVLHLNSSIPVTEFECRIKSDHRFCLHFHNLLPCNGDVGSPIICDGEFYALFSPNTVIYPKVCMERYGTTFVKVHSVKDWVERIINAPQISMEWMNNPFYILLLCGAVLAVIGGIYYLIMEWLQKTFEPLATESVNEVDGEDDINSEWTKT